MLKNIFIGALGVAGIAFLGYLLFRKTPKKYYKKARSAHKQGEKSYGNKDFELANDYYGEAEKFRNKARELEKKKGESNA